MVVDENRFIIICLIKRRKVSSVRETSSGRRLNEKKIGFLVPKVRIEGEFSIGVNENRANSATNAKKAATTGAT